ncbi:glycosyltransferase family 4 protein [Brevibacterium litoralis]|uniref:glycosyltransferase family 4 protein n=1 Tax=Brevibacterium litoralis TaxID=3138935 RepID=UPI0032F00761
MTRPKIAVVNVFFPPQSIGGATRVVADNVTVLERDHSDEFDFVYYTSDVGSTPAHQVNVYTLNGRRVYRAGVLHRPNMDWHPFDPESGAQFGKFLDHEKPDLVHFHCIQRLTASIVEETLTRNIPYLVTLHDAWWISDLQFLVDPAGKVYPDGHPDPYEATPLPNGVTREESMQRRLRLRSLLNSSSRVLTVSEAFAEIHRKNHFPQVEVTLNGVAKEGWLPKEPSKSGRVRMAHIGGMEHHKGFYLLRDVLKSGQFANVELTVVDHSKPHGYRKSERWGATEVAVIGKIPQAGIAELYARTDVLLAPSTWPESFGLVTREAAAAGCWVVTSDIGAIGEQVDDGVNGIIVKSNDRRSLREAVALMDSNPHRYLAEPPKPDLQTPIDQVKRLVHIYRETLRVRM